MRQSKTTEQFKQGVYDLVGDEYTVQGEYGRAKIKIKMCHKLCNKVYEVRPNAFFKWKSMSLLLKGKTYLIKQARIKAT